jgi:hypothetical protein
MSKTSFIDTDAEHNQVLYELGILDDDDDWQLFCKMLDEEVKVDKETWCKYAVITPRKIPT